MQPLQIEIDKAMPIRMPPYRKIRNAEFIEKWTTEKLKKRPYLSFKTGMVFPTYFSSAEGEETKGLHRLSQIE